MATPFNHTIDCMRRDRSSHVLLVWLLVLIILFAWLCWFLLAQVSVYEVSKTARLQVEQAFHPLTSSIDATVVSSKLELGKKVRQGEILVTLADGDERLRIREAQARLDGIGPQIDSLRRQIADLRQAGIEAEKAAGNALEQAQSRFEDARAAVRFARVHWQRLRKLNRGGQIARVNVQQAHRALERSTAESKALASEIKRLQAHNKEEQIQHRARIQSLSGDIAALQSQAALTRAGMERLRLKAGQYFLRAPVAGEIGEIAVVDRGAFVKSGSVLARIVPAGKLNVVASFAPRRAMGRLRSGQPARMRLHGFPWTQYGSIPLRVHRVGLEIQDGGVRVELQPMISASPLLRHGFTGTVEVEVEKATPALLVLRTAGQWLSRPAPEVLTGNQTAGQPAPSTTVARDDSFRWTVP